MPGISENKVNYAVHIPVRTKRCTKMESWVLLLSRRRSFYFFSVFFLLFFFSVYFSQQAKQRITKRAISATSNIIKPKRINELLC